MMSASEQHVRESKCLLGDGELPSWAEAVELGKESAEEIRAPVSAGLEQSPRRRYTVTLLCLAGQAV